MPVSQSRSEEIWKRMDYGDLYITENGKFKDGYEVKNPWRLFGIINPRLDNKRKCKLINS